MLLTLTDTGIGNIDLHGGKNLSHLIAATRQFVYRTNANVNVHEFSEDSAPYTDKIVTVDPIIALPDRIRKRNYEQFKKDDNGTCDMEASSSDSDAEKRGHPTFMLKGDKADDYRKNVISQMFTNIASTNGQKAPGHTIEADCTPRFTAPTNKPKRQQPPYLVDPLPKTSAFPAAISYIWKGPTVPRKFNKEAALKLGLKPGPNYGKLQKGISVTTDDGRVITQDMVCEPERPGHVFIVVDCPSVTYIDSLIHNAKFDLYKKNGTTKAHVMIHFVGKDVLRDQRYLDWLHGFDTETDHVFASTEICAQTVQFRSHALGQVKLSMLNKDIFPIPHYNNTPELALDKLNGLPERSYALKSMDSYILEPKPQLQHSDIPLFDHTNSNSPEIQELNQLTEYHEAVKIAKQQADKVQIDEIFPGSNVEIITLGTGSSIPAKYRNVSATYIKIPGYGSIMLDAGEGTYGQLMRRFGIRKLGEELKSLRCIFVSHLHADHHLGVIQLINKWNKMHWEDDATLTIVAPFIYMNWLKEYNRVEYFLKKNKVKFIRNESILASREPVGEELKSLENLKTTLGLSVLEPVDVIHCLYAYGLSLEHESGWKLVYSGDTRPCNKLVERGKDATILIHEATLEDAEKEKAIAKRHTTLSEAIEVGERMNARFTLLNHFSQRYPKLPVLSKDLNVCFSFDLMSLPIKHLPLLPKYTDAMLLAFKDDDEDNNTVKK
ncbi:beta-lactamase-like protein [Mycotypha africana]|uniref:beta-lactamase-like protein n=1 Tax=Mycotypha africana TaxID=64632 RepID=UPI00230057D3|nr:beta-lactamase-like protein [Mycotypha africana]KAI8971600.1 beta-lactamase-like protein [Mycotypha africana]